MIPVFDIDVEILVGDANLVLPSLGEWEDGGWYPGINREYAPIEALGWDELDEMIALERQTTGRGVRSRCDVGRVRGRSRAPSRRAFEHGPLGLDLGVASLVHALNTAGFLTYWSCRGHARDDRPYVAFSTDAAHLDALVPLVRESEVGLWATDYAEVASPCVTRFVDLASLISHERVTWQELPALSLDEEPSD